MSIAITPMPIKAQAPATTGSASTQSNVVPTENTTTPVADFAQLLIGQLAVGADLQTQLATAPPATADSEQTIGEAPQDAAALLASLGFMPVDKDLKGEAKKSDILLPEAGDKGISGIASTPLAGLRSSTATSAGTSDAQTNDGLKFNLESNTNTALDLPDATQETDKPAKFAVPDFLIQKAEAVSTAISTELPVKTDALAPNQAPHQVTNTGLNSSTTLKVETPVRDSSWAGDFGQKIVWMAGNDKQVAQLTLNPPQMGPIEISLSVNKDNASAFFASPNAEVREAIESAIPRLREMLAGVGIDLGQANVSAESFRQQAGQDGQKQGTPRFMVDNAILGADSLRNISGQSIMTQRGNGLVDTFA